MDLSPDYLDDLAERLTRHLGIAFHPTPQATLESRRGMRIGDWAVPLLFDGHASDDDGTLLPVDFVGHALWPHLRAEDPEGGRRRWSCTLPAQVVLAMLEFLTEGEADDDGHWPVADLLRYAA